MCLRIGSICEHDKEPSGSSKAKKLFDQYSDYPLLKDFAPWRKLLLRGLELPLGLFF
jgi:hypothetical protein